MGDSDNRVFLLEQPPCISLSTAFWATWSSAIVGWSSPKALLMTLVRSRPLHSKGAHSEASRALQICEQQRAVIFQLGAQGFWAVSENSFGYHNSGKEVPLASSGWKPGMPLNFLTRHRTAFAIKKKSVLHVNSAKAEKLQKQRILLLKCGKEEVKILSDFKWVMKIPAYQ